MLVGPIAYRPHAFRYTGVLGQKPVDACKIPALLLLPFLKIIVVKIADFPIVRSDLPSQGSFFRLADRPLSAKAEAVFPAMSIINRRPVMNPIRFGRYVARQRHDEVCDANVVSLRPRFSNSDHTNAELCLLGDQRGATIRLSV